MTSGEVAEYVIAFGHARAAAGDEWLALVAVKVATWLTIEEAAQKWASLS